MKEQELQIKRGTLQPNQRAMTDKQAGQFVKGCARYAYDGKPFFTKDAYLQGVFMRMQRRDRRLGAEPR